jgi:hypothetical protein
MPRKYVAEMFCDRVAACRIYLGDKYVHASVDVSAIFIGSEYRCLCNECRKKILEEAIRKFT